MGIYAHRNIPTKADFSTEFTLSNTDTVNIISTWKNQVGAATGGMGANQLDRTHVRAMKGEKTAFSARDEESITIPSYNEIMEQHCKNNVLGRLNLQLKTTTTKHIQTHNYFFFFVPHRHHFWEPSR
jgi:hypothetical protein